MLSNLFFGVSCLMLCRFKVVGAGSGRSHTVVVTEDGQSLSFGWNKHGQLGSGSVRNGKFAKFALIL